MSTDVAACNYLKCRLCSWKTAKRYTRKNGSFSDIENAFNRLRTHYYEKHPEVMKMIEEREAADAISGVQHAEA